MTIIKLLKNTAWDQTRPYLDAKALDRQELPPTGGVVRTYNSSGQFLGLGLYSPEAAQPLVWLASENVSLSAVLQNLVVRAHQRRIAYFSAGDAYRLIHDSSDGLPGLNADWLSGHIVLTTRTSAADALLEALAVILLEALKPLSITVKNHTSERSQRSLPLREATLAGVAETHITICEGSAKYDYPLLEPGRSFPLMRRPVRQWLDSSAHTSQKILVIGLEAIGLLRVNSSSILQTISEPEQTQSDLTFALRKLPPQPTFATAVLRLPPLATTANRTAAHHTLHQICLRLKDAAELIIETRDVEAALIFLRRFSQKNGQRFMILDQCLPGPDFAADVRFTERDPKFLRLTVRTEFP